MVSIADVLLARQRLRPHLQPTPVEAAIGLGEHIYFKLENLNPTRSFKIRGALNAVSALTKAEKQRGIVTCSAGNHAQGMAYAAQLAGAKATIVMPKDTPQRKVEGTRRYEAEVILHGDLYDDAEIHAHEIEAERKMTFVSPYNHPQVIAGQGTIGLELFEQLPHLSRLVVPVGGGGMISGIGIVAKTLNPKCEVIGVQSKATPEMYNFLKGTAYPQAHTLAEGLAGVVEAGSITFDLCKQVVDDILLVEESDIAEAMRWMLQQHNWVIEGSAGVGIAAFLTGKLKADERETAIIICGSNIDYDDLQQVIFDTRSL